MGFWKLRRTCQSHGVSGRRGRLRILRGGVFHRGEGEVKLRELRKVR